MYKLVKYLKQETLTSMQLFFCVYMEELGEPVFLRKLHPFPSESQH